jgi:hypothetical protein
VWNFVEEDGDGCGGADGRGGVEGGRHGEAVCYVVCEIRAASVSILIPRPENWE